NSWLGLWRRTYGREDVREDRPRDKLEGDTGRGADRRLEEQGAAKEGGGRRGNMEGRSQVRGEGSKAAGMG
ncbi:hypothetical protein KI387_014168, partial [Taxus chinensis]